MRRLYLCVCLLVLTIAGCTSTQYPAISHDGLQLLPDSKLDAAYKKMGAEFSVYKRFMVTRCDVAFVSNWQRDQNKSRSLSNDVSNKDVEKIINGLSEMCRATFVEDLEAGGYELVSEAAADVLIIRPSIINLDITAPDVGSIGRSRTYVTSAGSMTLNLELYDSVSHEILARVVDKKKARDNGTITWSSSITNRNEARRMFRRWSKMLVENIESIRTH